MIKFQDNGTIYGKLQWNKKDVRYPKDGNERIDLA